VHYQENGAKVIRADLIYKLSGPGGWLRNPATLASESTVTTELPAGTTHYYINLIDENNYLVSYPQIVGPDNPFLNGNLVLAKALRAER
jgi:hypothetical protein